MICVLLMINCEAYICTIAEILAFQIVRTDRGVQGIPIVLEAIKYVSKQDLKVCFYVLILYIEATQIMQS